MNSKSRWRRIHLIIIVFVASSLMPQIVAAKSKDYILECRGGGHMKIKIAYSKWVSINFTKSKTAAIKKKPSEGECAWLDRPVSSNEPSTIYYESKKHPVWSAIEIDLSKRYQPFISWYQTPITHLISTALRQKPFIVHVKQVKLRGGNRVLKIVKFGA